MQNITGQMFFRETSEKINNKRLFLTCGLITLPQDSFIKSEYLYRFEASEFLDEFLTIRLFNESSQNLKNIAYGKTTDQILKTPIWSP